jgi:hypothetical protein
MNLTEEQKRSVASWIHEGLKLSDIQSRLASEMGITVTYMEVRFLVDDLRLMPKDPPPPPEPAVLKSPAPSKPGTVPDAPHDEGPAPEEDEAPEPMAAPPAGAAGKVTLTVDKLAVPGTIISGSVSFSDGKTAQWYLDEMGRLGLAAKEKGYRPSAPDLQSFQLQLQRELQRLGF